MKKSLLPENALKRVLAVMLMMLMLLQNVSVAFAASPGEYRNKISKNVYKAFEKNDKVSFIVKMKEQPDPMKIAYKTQMMQTTRRLPKAEQEKKIHKAVVKSM